MANTTSRENLPRMSAILTPVTGAAVFSGNKWYSPDGAASTFKLDGVSGSFSTFAAAFSDTTSTFSEPTFPDATRSIETYMTSLGETATIDAFINKCRAQDRYNWDTRFTAQPVNSYLRAGFFSESPVVALKQLVKSSGAMYIFQDGKNPAVQ